MAAGSIVRALETSLPSGSGPAWSTMRHLGSPFAQALAGAWELGTVEQRTRLETAFSDLVAHYADIALDALIEVKL